MRGVGGVGKSIHQSWLAKRLGLGLVCWGFKGVQEEIPSEEASTLQIGSVAFPPGQYTSPQLHPCHRLFDQGDLLLIKLNWKIIRKSWCEKLAKSKIIINKVKVKVKLFPLVEGDPKAPFLIATTPRCCGGCYSYLWITPLYPRYVPHIDEC